MAVHPRMLLTIDESGNFQKTVVRQGTAVDIVGQIGRPKTITGFQTLETPTLLQHSDRAELATDEYISLTPTLEWILTSHFLAKDDIIQDEWILNTLVSYIKDIRIFITELSVQKEWEYQKLKRYFCELLENVYEGVCRTSDPLKWISLNDRVSYFCMIQEWCGYNSYETFTQKHEERIKQLVLDQYKDIRDCNPIIASLEIEKKNLEVAALNCMASLCSGEISHTMENNDNKVTLFDIDLFFRWIDALFLSQNKKIIPFCLKKVAENTMTEKLNLKDENVLNN
ncbi:hypothetical protein PCK1_000969 [Pneumocystis canis]|nr:hypothetical protein PCK1_000969 [Pneumocystis canis]